MSDPNVAAVVVARERGGPILDQPHYEHGERPEREDRGPLLDHLVMGYLPPSWNPGHLELDAFLTGISIQNVLETSRSG